MTRHVPARALPLRARRPESRRAATARSAVLREENLRRKLIRVLVRKHADDLEYTDEHRAQARTLAQASVVDGAELRREADSIAEQIADTQDDAAAYAREALPVDEALVEQAIEADRAND